MQKEYKIVIITVSIIILMILVFSGVNYLYNLSKTSQGFLGELFTVEGAVAYNYFEPCEIPEICNSAVRPPYCYCYWIYHNECKGQYPELYEWLSEKCVARNCLFNS